MNGLLFSESFNFNRFELRNFHYTDNRHGCKYHYLARLIKGNAKIIQRDLTLELKSGDCFYIPINCSYRSYWYGNPDIVFDSFGFTYFPNPEDNEYTLQRLCTPNAFELLRGIDPKQNHACLNIAEFYKVLGGFLPHMNQSYKRPKEKIIHKASEYLELNPHCKISEAARHCGISESGLYSTFRELTGQTPTDIKQRLQIERALVLLRSTDLKIELIAERCGFCSAIYFRKVFKKVTGDIPSSFRKSAAP